MDRAIKDFTYNKRSLSDFGMMVDDGGGLDEKTIDRGGNITFSTIKTHDGKLLFPLKSKFEDTITANFRIIKDPTYVLNNLAENEDYSLSEDDGRIIFNWLDTPLYKKAIFETGSEVYMMDARFQLKRVEIGGKLYGYDVTMFTLSPYCYGHTIKRKYNINNVDKNYILLVDSDEFGLIYPKVDIIVNKAGDFELENLTTGAKFSLKNCSQYEQFGQEERTQILTLSEDYPHSATDFNYGFFNLRNMPFEPENKFKVNLKCEITFSYTPRYRGVI